MSLRQWMREQLLGGDADGNDLPPHGSLVNSALGRAREQPRALGEFNAETYPADLADALRRREEVSRSFMRIDVTDRDALVAAIPQLKEMLRRYPHPLVYEALIHGYVEAGQFDEARGVAFAARERRQECARSPHPEIRAEIDRLREWSPEEVDALRAESAERTRR